MEVSACPRVLLDPSANATLLAELATATKIASQVVKETDN
jgi:hypothetical protein